MYRWTATQYGSYWYVQRIVSRCNAYDIGIMAMLRASFRMVYMVPSTFSELKTWVADFILTTIDHQLAKRHLFPLSQRIQHLSKLWHMQQQTANPF
jgi:hypothetical protein